MSIKKLLNKIDPAAECKKYGLGFWQCPNCLFLIMGVIIITAMLTTYWIGIHFVEPELVIVIVTVVTMILLTIGHSLVNSFARIAEANRMKSEFVSIVSHQLRTPLSALKWSLDLLRGKRLGELNKKQQEYFDIINDSSIKMIKLVNDLLNVNRIEQRKLSTRPREFSLFELINDAIKELNVLAEVHGVKIIFKDSKDFPNVYADPDRVRMVVQNLIDNAIKYSKKEKGGVVEIVIKKASKGTKKMLKTEVTDNGMGIPVFMQKQVFGKFFRGDTLIKQKVEGTGLGLFIARGIINLSGGEISFMSEKGKGSTFWFTLPINKNKKAKSKPSEKNNN